MIRLRQGCQTEMKSERLSEGMSRLLADWLIPACQLSSATGQRKNNYYTIVCSFTSVPILRRPKMWHCLYFMPLYSVYSKSSEGAKRLKLGGSATLNFLRRPYEFCVVVSSLQIKSLKAQRSFCRWKHIMPLLKWTDS